MNGVITKLSPMEIFVFGSNLAGRHGAGAALYARMKFGAVYGRGQGLQGKSYAIPTKGWNLEPLPLERIKEEASDFLFYAQGHSNLTFRLTRIGCGRAGYTDEQIAPFFTGYPVNVIPPSEWRKFLERPAL